MQKAWLLGACLGMSVACSSQSPKSSDEAGAVQARRAPLSNGVAEEVLLDAPVSTPLFAGAPQRLSIAADPDGFFVSWVDWRENRGVDAVPGALNHVVGTRVSNSGAILNPSGLIISQGRVASYGTGKDKARSAFNGQYDLVAWHEFAPSPTNPLEVSQTAPTAIKAVRVSTSGELLDAQPIVIATLPPGDTSSVDAVLSNGADFFVAWSGENASAVPGHVQSRTVSFAGSVPTLAPVTTYAFSGTDPSKYAFAVNGLAYVVAAVNAGSTGFTVGSLSHPASNDCPTSTSPDVEAVALGSNGAGEMLVAYSGRVIPQSGACNLGSAAVLIGSDGTEKAPPIPLGSPIALPNVSYTQGKYIVGSFQIDPGTNSAVPITTLVPETAACNASTCLAAAGNGVFRISPAGAPVDDPPIVIGAPARAENEPIVTAGAGKYLAVWYEQSGEYQRVIHAGRVDGSGASLDSIPIPISGELTDLIHADFNGTDFVVSWLQQLPTNDYSYRLSRISPAGVLKDAAGVEVTRGTGNVLMACAPGECLVAWSDTSGGTSATRVNTDSVALDAPPVQVLPKGAPQMLAYADGGYVLEYLTSDQPIDVDHPGKFFLQKLTLSGQPVGVPILVPGTPQTVQRCGSGYLARTFSLVNGAFTWRASLRDGNAQVTQATIDLGTPSIWEPINAASIAGGCLIAWSSHTDNWDVSGKLLNTDAGGLTSDPLPISADPYNEFGPALATGADGKVLAVYRHFIARAPYGSYRTASRLIDPAAFALGTSGGGGGEGGQSSSNGGSTATGGNPGDQGGGGGLGGAPNAGSTGTGAFGGSTESGGGLGGAPNAGSTSTGAFGGSTESGDAGEANAGHAGGEAGAAGSPPSSGGAATEGGAGGSVTASSGNAGTPGAGTAGAGTAGARGGNGSGGSGCTVSSSRRPPSRAAFPITLALLALAEWRRRGARSRQRGVALPSD